MTTRARLDKQLESLRLRGEPHCLVTVVRTADATSAKAGARALVTADGELHGFIGGTCVHANVLRVAREVLERGEPRMVSVRPRETIEAARDADGVELYPSACPSGGTVDLFVEPFRRPPALVVCGDSPVAHALLAQAQALGLAERHVAVLDASTQLSEETLDARDAVVVATQGRGDLQAIRAALASAAGYIGMVGSKAKLSVLRERLEGELSPGQLERLRGPAGLHIGAIEPEEIAVSIAAELVAWRRSG